MAEREERRKSKRLGRHFVVAYRVEGLDTEYDLSQIKNISKGGLRFITSKQYPLGTVLAVELRTPLTPERIKLLGKVVGSETVVERLIYDTRISYVDINKDTEEFLERIIQHFSQNNKRKGFLEGIDK